MEAAAEAAMMSAFFISAHRNLPRSLGAVVGGGVGGALDALLLDDVKGGRGAAGCGRRRTTLF